ncbi:MAG TPA: flavodoxin-dependent (E)-4-hydroxy-3-methylbut-2-enyl-diphosphate synthase, partial [Bacilli bacterium]|nr:flavodoxin-dependent (E)-4-hydroxy-3-methylbut-2-enyl-diphosphate synthase [Bacilli bacterium]
ILESFHFHNIILSVKSTNLEATIEAYKVLNANYSYPLHIGITESGPKQMGTIKSSIGLGILLYEGIGDTIRVSLTADPVEEISVAKDILASLGLYNKPVLISCPTCGRTEYNMMEITKEIESFLNTLGNVKLTVAIMGCAVNGPAEAKDADIGIAGGKGEALLFKKGQAIRKIKAENIVKELKNEINKMIKGEF